MYCTACGKAIPDDARFCSYCAAPIAAPAPPGSAAPPPAPAARRELVRPREGRWIAGVCLGVARHFGWDPVAVRLIWLLLLLFAGTGVLLYVILWIVMPNE